MNRSASAIQFACILAIVLAVMTPDAALAQEPAATAQINFIEQNCQFCHQGGTFTSLVPVRQWVDEVDMTLSSVAAEADIWEGVIRKVRGRMMPPAGWSIDATAADSFVAYLEDTLDRAVADGPNPGRKDIHRLNRTEYGNVIRDLFDIEFDSRKLLPPDTALNGFDNIAEVLGTDSTLMGQYLSAAWKATGLAVGDVEMQPAIQSFLVTPDHKQDTWVEGLPRGTRGGHLVKFYAPVDGEYTISPRLMRSTLDVVRGLEFEHTLEVSVDGSRVHLETFGGSEEAFETVSSPSRKGLEIEGRLETTVTLQAGPHDLGIAFLKKTSGVRPDLIEPFFHELDFSWFYGDPQVKLTRITGPLTVTGVSESPSRRQIFTCYPASEVEASGCAESILTTMARRAYRRPPTDTQLGRLMDQYQSERDEGGSFDWGIQKALTYMLVTPQFLFRHETDPEDIDPGSAYKISDLELASRLSFFLWSSIPDDQLLDVAVAGRLSEPAVLEQQVRRMLTDSRAEALVTNFAEQWLGFRNLQGHTPNNQVFPDFDDTLRQSFRRETELLFLEVISQDLPIHELLTADYTYINERVALAYGIPDIYGEQFRRVELGPDSTRKGILGHGAILMVNSYPNRTSPVLRGNYILTNILGTPAPDPPANVPALDEELSAPTTMRERMEQHRANPACSGCHQLMDPIGLALENYDGLGRWREDDGGAPVDANAGVIHILQDYGSVAGPLELGEALIQNPDRFAQTAAERLLTYALGRSLEAYDMPIVRDLTRAASENDYRFSSFIMGIVNSVPFQMRVSDTGPPQSARVQ